MWRAGAGDQRQPPRKTAKCWSYHNDHEKSASYCVMTMNAKERYVNWIKIIWWCWIQLWSQLVDSIYDCEDINDQSELNLRICKKSAAYCTSTIDAEELYVNWIKVFRICWIQLSNQVVNSIYDCKDINDQSWQNLCADV